MAKLVNETISIIVTTYRSNVFYAQKCLDSIAKWKMDHHEVIVVVHDETALMKAYLESMKSKNVITKLIYSVTNHGHTKGYNLGVTHSTGDVIFNICDDIMIGPSLVDDCAYKLRTDKDLGLIGWHWYNEGTFWNNDKTKIVSYEYRDDGTMAPNDIKNVQNAKWYTGEAFKALDGPKWLCLCNTAFFGIRREVLEKIGNGFDSVYKHYWADDFLNYAVLDLKLNISHFEAKFRNPKYFYETQYLVEHQPEKYSRPLERQDRLEYDDMFLDSCDLLDGGMTRDELKFLHTVAQTVKDGSVVTNVGTWRGASCIALLDALKGKNITFNFIDCFDLPEISKMSNQPPVTIDEFSKYIAPYVDSCHDVNIIKGNTLEMSDFPQSDFFFIDAGHTKVCIENDIKLAKRAIKPDGIITLHDYGQPAWPDVKPAIDAAFETVYNHHTVAVCYDMVDVKREQFKW